MTKGSIVEVAVPALAMIATLVIVATRIPYPIMGDQALFLVGAMELASGGTLYVDFWDNKQPGIYWFYWLAGTLFGFNPIAIHIFEAIWMLLAATALTRAVDLEARQRWIALLTPLMTVGLLYWNAGISFLTQVETLVALPLGICVALAVESRRRTHLTTVCMLGFGAMAAIAATFKLVLVIVPVTMWLVLLFWTFRENDRGCASTLLANATPLIVGGVLVIATVISYFLLRGAIGHLAWTTLSYPAMAANEIAGKSWRDLAQSGMWLARIVLAMFPLAIFAIRDLRRERLRLIEALSLAWLVSGGVAILVQWFSWWGYHFCLLVVPVGLLVTCALDRLVVSTWGNKQSDLSKVVAVYGLIMLCFLASSAEGFRALKAAWSACLDSGYSCFTGMQLEIDPGMEERLRLTAFLSQPGAEAGAIYVFGDPRMVLESGRRYAIPTHGWSWEMLVEEQWSKLEGQLRNTSPPYIYVDNGYAILIEARSPETKRLLSDVYAVLREDPEGTWYIRRD